MLSATTSLDQKFIDYVDTHIFGDEPIVEKNNAKLAVKIILALLGATWGIPWRTASADAAVIFPEGLVRDIIAQIFAGGIVVTVGADGIWIMLQVGSLLDSPNAALRELVMEESRAEKISKLVVPFSLAGFSCISPVYASVKFNDGIQKLYSGFTFIGNYGNGVFGYRKLLDAGFDKIRKKGAIGTENIRSELIERVKLLKTSAKRDLLLNIKNLDDLIACLNSNNLSSKAPSMCFKVSRGIYQGIPTISITSVSFTIGFLLTKEFLKNNIWSNLIFAVVAAIFSETPGAVAGVISNLSVFGKLFDLMTCHVEGRTSAVAELYPVLKIVFPIGAFVVSSVAPPAAAYIIYNTFLSNGYTLALTGIATGVISAARYIFANFTLNSLFELGLLKIAALNPEFKKIIENDAKFDHLLELLQKAKPESLAAFRAEEDEKLINAVANEEAPLIQTRVDIHTPAKYYKLKFHDTKPEPVAANEENQVEKTNYKRCSCTIL